MHTSLLVARLLGLAYLAIGVGIVGNSDYYKKLIDDALKSPKFVYLCGLLSLTVGLILVTFHNVWEQSWFVVITLVGWISLAKGLVFLILPEKVVHLVKTYIKGRSTLVTEGLLVLLLGLFLSYFGFIH